ncbi:efflux RND transporter periplasmic adaptor subunit [Maricaulaceae bacterium MS644]
MKQFSIGAGAFLLFLSACSDQAPENGPAPRVVETFEVRSSDDRSAPVYSGVLRALQRSDLSFLRGGQVVELSKNLGETFAGGETLARLDSTELSLAAEELAANLAGAQSELADAQLNYDRLVGLDGTGAVSRSEIDAATARLDTARARVRSVQAAIGQARQRLSETTLRAPYDGQIVERLIEPSQTAAAGQPVYRVIGDEGGLEAVVNLPVTALDLFVPGFQTDVLVRPSGVRRSATVTEVGNAAGRSGLYPVTLQLADSTGLRPGLRVEAPGLESGAARRGPVIPLTAYRAGRGSSAGVFVVDVETGRISLRSVSLGSITDRGIEVVSGLETGDRIVARGLPSLRDGDVVVPLGVGVQQFNE